MTKLLYAGPDLETLHADYATQGRIDARAPATASRDVVICRDRDHGVGSAERPGRMGPDRPGDP